VIAKLLAWVHAPRDVPASRMPHLSRVAMHHLENESTSLVPTPIRAEAARCIGLNPANNSNAIRDLFALDFDINHRASRDDPADGSFVTTSGYALYFHVHTRSRYMSRARRCASGYLSFPPAKPALQVRGAAPGAAERSSKRRSSVRLTRRHRDPLRLPR